MLRFVEHQIVFTVDTTRRITSGNDFMVSQDAMVLYNSTCMCLQTIGETLRQVDDLTNKLLLRPHYPQIPWRAVFSMRNVISHEYAATDPEIIYQTVKQNLMPLLQIVRSIITDVENESYDFIP